MNIVIITNGTLPVPNVKGGGAETLVTALVSENEKNNNKMKVFSIANKEADEESKKYHNTFFYFMKNQKRTVIDRLRCRLLNDFPREHPYSFSKVYRQIKNSEIDKIIIENSPWQFPYFVKKFGEKVYLHLHNDWINESLDYKYRKRYINAINNSGGVIAVSQYLKERIKTVGLVDDNKIKVLYNATDVGLFLKKSNSSEINNLKSKLDIKESDIVLIYSGRLCKEKGVLELIKAFEKVEKYNATIKLVIIGSVSYGENTNDEYTEQIEKYVNNNHNIITTGFVDYKEISKYYQIGDIQVIPSVWNEPFGLVAIEGAASGLPIISTDSGGLREIFENNYALVVDRNNIVDNLEKAITKLISNKDSRYYYIEKSKQLIKDHQEFDYKCYYKQFLNIIE